VLITSVLAIISVTHVARQYLAKIATGFEAFAVSSLVLLVVLLIALFGTGAASHCDLSSRIVCSASNNGTVNSVSPVVTRFLASSCGAVIHQDHFLPYGAGTFGLLVTLKKRERFEKCRRKIARIELAHRL